MVRRERFDSSVQRMMPEQPPAQGTATDRLLEHTKTSNSLMHHLAQDEALAAARSITSPAADAEVEELAGDYAA